MKKYRFGVVLSTALGNSTRYFNFKKYAMRDPDVEFFWAPVKHYFAPDEPDPFKRLPDALRYRAIVFYQAWPVLRHIGSLDAMLIHMYEVDIFTALRSYLLSFPLRVVSTDNAPIVEPDSYPIYPHDKDKPGWRQSVRLSIDLWRARRADLLVPFSSWAGDIFVRLVGVPGERVLPLHVGVDLEYWTDRAETIPTATDARRAKLLFVGAEFERKGGDLLLEVFIRHFSGIAELHLVTRTAPRQLPEHVFVYDNLSVNDSKLKQLYQQADILVHPTTCDLSAWVVLEALASGCPPVTTRIAGITELVVDGETGLLVPPGNSQALAAAIQSLIDNPETRRAMGKRGRRFVEKNFDAAVNVPKIIHMMKSAVDSRRTRRKPS